MKITAMEEKREKLGLTPAKFYACPRDPPSESKLPIFDHNHTQNAMARFNQTDFEDKEEKTKAYNKIYRAAQKFGIDIDEFKDLKP